ncbi:hypothetical protein FB451DRAFT_1375610 [Mycena latifolia]|nr:hypothetical protein FB451DRAFT_1375610 [Mycena latifolia]
MVPGTADGVKLWFAQRFITFNFRTLLNYESEFGTNIVGHFILPELLKSLSMQRATNYNSSRQTPALTKSCKEAKVPARIINTSSISHRFTLGNGVDFATLKGGPERDAWIKKAGNFESCWSVFACTAGAKIGKIFVSDFVKTYSSVLISCALHPGGIETNLYGPGPCTYCKPSAHYPIVNERVVDALFGRDHVDSTSAFSGHISLHIYSSCVLLSPESAALCLLSALLGDGVSHGPKLPILECKVAHYVAAFKLVCCRRRAHPAPCPRPRPCLVPLAISSSSSDVFPLPITLFPAVLRIDIHIHIDLLRTRRATTGVGRVPAHTVSLKGPLVSRVASLGLLPSLPSATHLSHHCPRDTFYGAALYSSPRALPSCSSFTARLLYSRHASTLHRRQSLAPLGGPRGTAPLSPLPSRSSSLHERTVPLFLSRLSPHRSSRVDYVPRLEAPHG